MEAINISSVPLLVVRGPTDCCVCAMGSGVIACKATSGGTCTLCVRLLRGGAHSTGGEGKDEREKRRPAAGRSSTSGSGIGHALRWSNQEGDGSVDVGVASGVRKCGEGKAGDELAVTAGAGMDAGSKYGSVSTREVSRDGETTW